MQDNCTTLYNYNINTVASFTMRSVYEQFVAGT